MLKIKDNVDLKELIKCCGFKTKARRKIYYRPYGSYFELLFHIEDRILGIFNYVDGGCGTTQEEVVKGFIGDLEALYFVEKVEDK